MKRFLSVLLAAMMLFSMISVASAESALAGTYDIVIWAPEAAVELTQQQVADFNASNSMGITINATVEPVSEADAATNMIMDVEAGGDLFFFAQDQLSRLIQAGALTPLGVAASEFVKTNNSYGSTVAAQAGDNYYAYPLTADNGYFMYYDKSIIPEEDIDSLEKLVEDCEAASKNFSFELENAWYNAGFFFGAGCHSDWITDDAGNFIAIDDDYNSDKGLIAAKGIYILASSPCYVNSSQADFASGSAVVVTGTWNYSAIAEQLGENFGVTDLPSFTVDGTEYHIGSYSGCKLLGVKPQEDAVRGAVLNQLAQYLTGKDCQLARFSNFGWGPSNAEALADPAVQADPTLIALNEQNNYAVPQPNIHGSWWDIAKIITTDIKGTDGSDDALQTALQKYEDSIAAVFEMTDEVRNAFTVIGTVNGTSWDVDLPMTGADGVWTTTEAYTMEAGTEFKVRQGKSWDVAYPADNFVVETAGTYLIQLDAATGTVSLVAQ
ncbi:MAG: extracellular solute-binding protein [Christensenellaceae bacterium]|nr:extracellular solute-binding protein [Christensenellaceae bacterium]